MGYGIVCDAQQIIDQTFTVEITGQLAGIEIAPGTMAMTPTTTHLQMRVLDASTMAELGKVIILATNFPQGYGTGPAAATIGPGYFDFTSFDILYSAGQTGLFEVTSPDMVAGACDGIFCEGNSGLCPTDAGCPPYSAEFGLGVSAGQYHGGGMLVNGMLQSDVELGFKTLVLP
jgi:hypothetical protein